MNKLNMAVISVGVIACTRISSICECEYLW